MPKKPKKFYKKTPPQIEERKNEKKLAKAVQNENQKEKGKEKPSKFPKNNRSIAESTPLLASKKTEMILFFLLTIVSLSGIIWIGNQAREKYIAFEKVDTERKKLQDTLVQWEEVAIAHPGSRDVYLHLASISYQLKDIQNAKKFTERALEIDPNYLPALEMEKIVK